MTLYAGMTVSERLVVTKLIEAIARRMIALLMIVELTAEQAAFTADTTPVSRG
jgi:hypothetical protein